ncbi:MAG: 30S ribosomal protein S17e [Candidatus Bathyarchaeia archaeon]
MGRIKTTLIKRVSKELLAKYPDKFTEDFALNKSLVDQLTDTESKKLAAQIAGHITRIRKISSGK